MRLLTGALQVLSLLTLTSAAACPFAQAAHAGLLNHADKAKYEAVERDGLTSNTFSKLHKKDGPGLNLLGLDLPLGGGLRTYRCQASSNEDDADQDNS